MAKAEDFKTNVKPTWCPGCGNFGLWQSYREALAELGLQPHNTAMVFDIGCCGNAANWHKLYAFHSLHGRTIPVAFAIKIANSELTVVADSGDGGGYGEGGNHFLHTCRTNIDITYIVHNNQIYGLTTGQASPTTEIGLQTKTTPQGQLDRPFHPLQVAIAQGATFVARGFTGDPMQLKNIIKEAIKHKGFSLVDILQPCITWNKLNTFTWYKQRVYKLEEQNWDAKDKEKALAKAGEWGDKIPTGIFYQEQAPSYESQLPQLKDKTLVEQGVQAQDISKFLKEFK
ncbi:2-oxoacid ferredoxin oxidoreductase [Candidatus Parcubacteria bacterium]|nr:MAG: 2-oxoacid ferredoxin oxidoreductase [Candidatus Parcubacteria bacterium]